VSPQEPATPLTAEELLAITARRHRRTALIELRGELDILTATQITQVIEAIKPRADGVRHIVLDLRGLTFMDVAGLREILRQNDFAHDNAHNLALVRGQKSIQALLQLTAVEELLVLVDDPDDLAPPPPG
jgi:anti-anti-sigma factor